jgi:kynurenine formamidase
MSRLDVAATLGPRWRRRPPGSNWGDFGADDRLGRLNLVGPDQVRRGIAEVHDGITFCLSLPLDLPGGSGLSPNRRPPIVRPTRRNGAVNFNCDISVAFPGATDVINDDLVVLHTQYSTQWDGLGHIGARYDADADGAAEQVYYNGWRADYELIGPASVGLSGLESFQMLDQHVVTSTSDAGPLDLTAMALHGVQGRAVLVDLQAHFGTARLLVGYAELMEVLREDQVLIEPGDFVVIHTGFARLIQEDGGAPLASTLSSCTVLDGGDRQLQGWIRDSGIAAIATDNYAVEEFPARGWKAGMPVLPLHELCLFELGIHLGELWWLSDLAMYLRATGRSRFLLTAPPLRLPKVTGSPVTPIATV